MRIFVGVDCDEHQLTMGFIGSQGILKSLSTTASPLPDHPDTFGQRLDGMIRMSRHLDIPIYIEGRDVLAENGNAWLKDVTNMIDPRINLQGVDLSVVYGAAKLAIDRAALR